MPSYDPSREEIVPFVRNHKMRDPGGTGLVGNAQTTDLTRSALAHPLVRYKDVLLELDVFHADVTGKDGAPGLEVLLLCPRCGHQLRITSDRKAIDFDPHRGAPQDGGQISIEPFECTWELDDERRQHGLSLCRWRVGIDRNVAHDH